MEARGRPRITRRTFAGAAALLALAGASGCTIGEDEITVVLVDAPPATTVLPGEDVAATATAMSALLFASADVAVLATADTVQALAPLAARTGIPLLVGTGDAVGEELSRLGVGTVLTAPGTATEALDGGLEILEIDPAAPDVALPEVRREGHPLTVTLCLDPDHAPPAAGVAAALVETVGGTVARTPGGDVGRSGASIDALAASASEDGARGILALGASFGVAESFPAVVQSALSTPQLPGGGITAFPGRRMVALYGTPHTPSLGMLGEQGLEESITRVQEMAAPYAELTQEPVVPAFEIIASIASAEAGGDGDYSRVLSPESLREWVDAAGEAGVYVVLDLQPGTTDFLTQAMLYEDLLTAPHVGLPLDPEWRLEPGQEHLEQIGSVTAAEITQVSAWLADLTAREALPQKVLILHQFTHSMISDRQDVDTSRPELAITLHADGHGTRGDKLATYRSLQHDLPEGIFMAWKNFHDEDTPMFTPEETYAVEPRPWFVSYQ